MEKLLSSEEAAEILGISTQTLARMAERGEIARIKVGGVYRFKPSDIAAFMERNREKASEEITV